MWAKGGAGGEELAEAVIAAAEQPKRLRVPSYPLEASIKEKIETIATKIYGADGVDYLPAAEARDQAVHRAGLRQAAASAWPRPTCRSPTTRPLKGRPRGFRVPIRDIRASIGAGLPVPAARRDAHDARPAIGRPPWTSTSTTTATSSGSSEVGGAGGLDGGIADDVIGRYLDALASAAPAPGGGSAAALAAALGAALVAMTCRVTAAREAAAAEALGALAEEADALRRRLGALADDDARAYAGVIAARRSPASSRAAAVEDALKRATDVPARLAAESRNVLALCERIAPCARASALSDLGVAALLTHGALRAATLTARTNLAGIADAAFTGAAADRLDALLAEGEELAARIEAARAARGGCPSS